MRKNSIQTFIENSSISKIDELSTDAQTFFDLLILIVDIEYKLKYGSSLEEKLAERYNNNTIKKVVADQVSPVDDGLLRH